MANLNILIAGFGGQGILFAGKILAYAGLLDGKEVSWLPSYGPEMRGGTCNCSICLSDEAVASPLVINPDVLVVMNQPSYQKFYESVVPGGTMIVDSTLVTSTCPRTDINVFYVPSTALANDPEQNLGSLANMILLGKMLKETSFASPEAVRAAVEKSVPARKEHLLDGNMRAIALGMER